MFSDFGWCERKGHEMLEADGEKQSSDPFTHHTAHRHDEFLDSTIAKPHKLKHA